jgi:hypothetical protein
MVKFQHDCDSDEALSIWSSQEEAGRICFQITEDGEPDSPVISLDPETIVAVVSYLNALQIKNMRPNLGDCPMGGCMGDDSDE